MRAAGAWLSVAVASVSGFALGESRFVGAVEAWVVGLLGFAVAAGVVAAVALGRARRRAGWPRERGRWGVSLWLAGACALATAHGMVEATPTVPPWREAHRGPARGMRDLAVVGASVPGARCGVPVRVAPQGGAVWLEAPDYVCPIGEGAVLRVPAEDLRLRTHARLPGQAASPASSRGVVARADVTRAWRVVGTAGNDVSGSVSTAIARLRHEAWVASRADPGARFVVACTLGLRASMSAQARRRLRRAGLGHLVAVSGLHVAIAAWLAARLLVRVGSLPTGSLLGGVVGSWIALAVYVAITGAPASAVRAALMAAGSGLAAVRGRPAHGVMLLVASSCAMLVARPAWAFDAGFQLSVVAMAAVVHTPRGAGLVRQTWIVTWAVVPVALLHFASVGAWAVVANLVAVPIVALWVLPWGLAGAALLPWLGPDALAPAALGARVVLAVADEVAGWPSPPSWVLAAVAAVGLLGWACRGRVPRRVRATVLAALPPRVPAVATLVVALLGTSAPSTTPSWSFVAIGTSREASLVVLEAVPRSSPGADPGEPAEQVPPSACLFDAVLPPSRWPAVLDAIGVGTVSAVLPVGRADASSPHLVATRRALLQAGRLRLRPGHCKPPPAEAVRHALAVCRRGSGRGQAVAEVAPSGHLRCFVRGRFVESGDIGEFGNPIGLE